MPKTRPVADIDIGVRLKSARTSRQLSQRELARKSGVTNGLISQIEQNHSSPSVSSLKRILDALPMSMSEFFAEAVPVPQKFVFRADELRELNPEAIFGTNSGAQTVSFRQVGDGASHPIQMLHERYPPGSGTGEELYSHDGDEVGIIIAGQIELTVGDKTETLTAGDAYMFDSALPHRFRNTSDADCIIVSACTPASF